MSPQRKSLDDDAAAFVFGGDDASTPAPPLKQEAAKPKTSSRKSSTPKQPSSKPAVKKTRAIDKLMQTTEQERQVRITVDLVESQHRGLTLASAQLGKTKAEIIRALLEDFLADFEQ